MTMVCSRKISTGILFISTFTFAFFNSFAFANASAPTVYTNAATTSSPSNTSSTLKQNNLTNFVAFDGTENSFVIPNATEYIDTKNNYSIIVQQGTDGISMSEQDIQNIVSNLPSSFTPSGAQIILADTAAAGSKNEDYLGLTYGNQIYIAGDAPSNTVVHELTHYAEIFPYNEIAFSENGVTSTPYVTNVYSGSQEYIKAFEEDQKLNGGKYATSYAANSDNGKNGWGLSEQFAELNAQIYDGRNSDDPELKALSEKAIAENPNQSAYIMRTLSNGDSSAPSDVATNNNGSNNSDSGNNNYTNENPYDINAYTDGNPYDINAYTNENPYDINAYINENPSDINAYTNENPSDINAYINENPSDINAYTNENPSDINVYTNENPSDINTYTNENPYDINAYTNENPSDINAYTNENPSDNSDYSSDNSSYDNSDYGSDDSSSYDY